MSYCTINELSLGIFNWNKFQLNGFIKVCDEVLYTKNALGCGGLEYEFHKDFEICQIDKHERGKNIRRCISLRYGIFYYEKINDTLLLSGNLCTLFNIKKDFPNYKFIGSKPFLQVI